MNQKNVQDRLREVFVETLNDPSFQMEFSLKMGDVEFVRVIGRESEQINVGGEKVFPVEVETVLLECPLVIDVVVFGSPHPLSGKIVCADIVRVASDMEDPIVRTSIRRFCNERLESYKVPVKIRFVEDPVTGDRQKRVRVGRSDV